jgi:nucleotide-binding universal stress UspA family protein
MAQPSDKALDHAVNIAKMSGKSEVILLYVIAEFPTYHFIERPARSIKTGEKTTVSQYLKEVYELMEESANDVLDKKKQDIKKTTGLEIGTRLLTGHISNSIIDFAAKEKVDLIVIGRRTIRYVKDKESWKRIEERKREISLSGNDYSLSDP